MKQGIWRYCNRSYKAYTEDCEVQNKLNNLKTSGCHLADFMYLLDNKLGCYYVFPAQLYDKVVRLFNSSSIGKSEPIPPKLEPSHRGLLIISFILFVLCIVKNLVH